MRLFGYELSARRAEKAAPTANATTLYSQGGWMSLIREPWGGAFQAGATIDSPRQILAYSAVYACVTMIASDIAKMRIMLVEEDANGICTEVRRNSPFLPVLKKPNDYQNRIRFVEQWQVSKLLAGNTFVLKERDARGIVVRMYVLNPQRVKIIVTESGDLYYELAADSLAGIEENVIVPASEMIHDTMVGLWHPLVGVSPIYACAVSATQGNKIQVNSTKFFDNMSRPSGMLTADGEISDEVATRLKKHWEENYTGANIGRLAVLGDGLKYEPMTIPAQEAQLIEQQKWTVEDVGRCFRMPLFKIGGAVPSGSSIEALNQMYYSDCLQWLIESMELCLDEGLALPAEYYTQFDLDGLIRMDTAARIEASNKAVGGGWMSPNEARAKSNLKPVKGGESPMMQQQNWNLEQLAEREAPVDKPSVAGPPVAPAPAPTANVNDGTDTEDAAEEVAALLATFTKELAADEVI